MPAQGLAAHLTDDSEHRQVVEPGVVKSVQQMDRAGSGGRHADAEFAGKLGMCGRHEGSHLLMADLDIVEFVDSARQPADQAIDTVARIAEDAAHAPFVQAFPKKVAYRLSHKRALPFTLVTTGACEASATAA